MFSEVYAELEQYTEDRENQQMLLQFVRRVEQTQRDYGNQFAVNLIEAFNVGYHCKGGIVPAAVGLVQMKLEIIRLKLGGR